jgi:Tfp pilus assembly protein PilF
MHLGHDHDPAEENPDLALKHYGRAIEYLRAGNRPKAIHELKQVLEYDPAFSAARAKLDELAE